ncbi:MAG: lipid-A-disaccharide synthase N-terminal domain-containing protein [Alphaproteobacteria bacterium]|nr:lipid-A-disaccharide synthase N-terminal domain-containing protein [Alphaproteobacteria bacterium]
MNATLTTAEIIWVVVGFFGQALFSMRFIIQWFVSERAKKSIVPVAFWYFSVLGGVTLLSYAIYRGDPVFIAGQAGGLVIYARNLYFIHKQRGGEADQVPIED